MSWQRLKTSNADWSDIVFTAAPTGAVGEEFTLGVSDNIDNNGNSENLDVFVDVVARTTVAPVNGEQPQYG